MINFLYIVYGNIDRINFNAYSTFKKKIISLLDGLYLKLFTEIIGVVRKGLLNK